MLAESDVQEWFAADIGAAVGSPKPVPAKGYHHFDTTLLADPVARQRFFDLLSNLAAEVAACIPRGIRHDAQRRNARDVQSLSQCWAARST